MNTYNLGQAVEILVSFFDQDDNLFDPVPAIITIQAPDRGETSFTYSVDAAVLRDAVGKYRMWTVPALPGRTGYKGFGGSDCPVVAWKFFMVLPTPFAS